MDHKEQKNEFNPIQGFPQKGARYGMKVPEDYFDNLADQILAKAHQTSEVRTTKVFSMRTVMTLAASVIVLAVATVVIMTRTNDDINTSNLASITSDEAYDYIYSNADLFSAEDIYVILGSDAELEQTTLDLEETNYAIDELLEDLDPEDLENLF